MVETTEQLERQLANAHDQLNSNLEVLETKTKELTDWRAQFDKRPLLLLGLAFGGGLLASGVVGGGRRSSAPQPDASDGRAMAYRAPQQPSPLNKHWGNVRDTLAAVATGAALELLHEAVPGFKEHYDRIKHHVA